MSALTPPALSVYGRALRAWSETIRIRMSDGSDAPLALPRYLGVADAVDAALLARVRGPVLDLGCGPGRHLHALARRGVFGLGVDLSPVAVELARDRGVSAMVASVFDELPGTGRWRTALLLDGNIGIGGDPARLLARAGRLLAPDGEALVELDPPGTPGGRVRAWLRAGSYESAAFAWARVPADGIGEVASAAGFVVAQVRTLEGRWFARLARDGMMEP